MPWKLIGFLLVLTLFLVFAGFNTHKVEIHFGPVAIPEIPMFVCLFLSFILGAIISLPFTIIKSAKKAKIKKIKKEKSTEKNEIEDKKRIKDNKNIINQSVIPNKKK